MRVQYNPQITRVKRIRLSLSPTPASKLLFSRFQTKKSLLSSLLQHCSKLITSPLLCFSKLLSPLRSSLLSCRVDVSPLPSPVAAIGKTSHGSSSFSRSLLYKNLLFSVTLLSLAGISQKSKPRKLSFNSRNPEESSGKA
ncbi:hypothetical protein ACOSQ3_001953 [Xanthoceras sorbifolium]